MELAVWLRSLGLEQYEATFRDNAITEKLLPSLTAEDLKDLGVSVVGHRRACSTLSLTFAQRRTPQTAAVSSFRARMAPPKEPRRAPPSHRDVFGLGGLNGALGAHGP